MLIIWLAMQVAGATPTTSSVVAAPSCRVIDAQPAAAPKGGAGLLVARCGRGEAVIGPASQYSSVTYAANGSVLVVRRRNQIANVLLISPASGKTGVAVNDVTRELTRLNGRSPDLGLGDAVVDEGRFAIDGSIGVTSAGTIHRLGLAPYAARAGEALPPPAAALRAAQ